MYVRVVLCVVLACVCAVRGDVFLHNPRGSNNRNNEDSADRVQSTRLFDSQNNARGGYCAGPAMNYVEGSILPVEWDSTHGCGIENGCTEILQYMCTNSNTADVIRDGTTTEPIRPDADTTSSTYYNKKDSDGQYTYGMTENFAYYQECVRRTRNKGLYLGNRANQINEGRGALATRQNSGGQNYGFECSEERAYYPYWHPSPWKDLAVFTSDTSLCPFYQAESQNVKAKNFCNVTSNTLKPNNKADCESIGGYWDATPSFGIPPPLCQLSTDSAEANYYQITNLRTFSWSLPTAANEPCIRNNSCSCMLRIRYNMTDGTEGVTGTFKDYRNSSVPTIYNLEGAGQTIIQNTFDGGRTFEDRSFTFHITPRPSSIAASTKVYNLNVKGKRGFYQQIYPALEYKFIPENLQVKVGEYIHFQWTGCDHNPAFFQGAGRDSLDRSNVVQIANLQSTLPLDQTTSSGVTPLFEDVQFRNLLANLNQSDCLSLAELIDIRNNGGPSVDDNHKIAWC